MEKKSNDELTIRRYLLKELSREELEQVEKQLLADGKFLRQVLLEEEELTYQYARGELTGDDRRKFEASFLATPEGVEQVELAKNLVRYVTEAGRSTRPAAAHQEPKPSRSWPMRLMGLRASSATLALAALAILFAVTAAGVEFQAVRLRRQIDEITSRQPAPNPREQQLQEELSEQQARNKELVEALQREQEQRARAELALSESRNTRDAAPGNSIASIILSPGRVRGEGQSQDAVLGAGVARLSIQLALRDAAYSAYRAVIQNDQGEQVRSADSLKAENVANRRVVRFSLPAGLLPRGDYQIKLQGITPDGGYKDSGSYYFRVIRK